jgi:putative ABC transport system permease protein
MDVLARRQEASFPGSDTDRAIGVAPLHDIMVGPVRSALVVLFAAVGMVLLIACANVANLLLVRGTARHNELAVRASLGASRGRLVAQMLAESVVLGACGAAAGVVVARWGIEALTAMAPPDIPRLDTVGVDPAVLGFAVALAVVTALAFGLGPAVSLARVPLASTLRVGGRGETGGRARGGQRAALLVAEVGLSVMLLVGAGLLLRSFAELQSVRTGWDARGVAVFGIYLPPARFATPEAMHAGFEALDARLSALPGVEVVGRVAPLPIGGGENVQSFTRPDLPPPPPGRAPSALYRVVDDELFRALRITILRGRAFAASDRAGTVPVIAVSRAFADRYFPGEDPLGRRLAVSDGAPPRTIVAVVADLRSTSLASAPAPEMFVPHAQTERRSMTFAVRGAAAPSDMLAAARAVVREFDPRLPLIAPRTMAAVEAEALARPRFFLLLVGAFAVLALVLASVGVYGVVAYLAAQRTREIGVRMALGARGSQVIRLVAWQGLRPALVGVVLGLAGALAGSHLMGGLLYGIAPRDPLTLAAVVPLLLAVVLAACAIPALRASRIPAVDALRAD